MRAATRKAKPDCSTSSASSTSTAASTPSNCFGDGLPKPTGQLPSGAPARYDPIREVVAQIWRAAEQPCGKRLVAALPLWLPHYAKHFGSLLPAQRKLLGDVSAATLDRLLLARRAGAPRG